MFFLKYKNLLTETDLKFKKKFDTVALFVGRVVIWVLYTSLKELPPGAYETVHWTTFIPHV